MTRAVLVAVVLLMTTSWAAHAEESSRGHMTGDVPAYRAEDAAAAVVTRENLLASERFWPYQVALVRPWTASPGGVSLPAGASAVLIRVEPSGAARLDFGRDGLFEVPVDATDLLERANRVRRGELEKVAPNFVVAIGPRLVDAAADPPAPVPFDAVSEQQAFLCVFADPQASGFEALAAELAPLRERAGVLTVLFPQGERADAAVRERLHALSWPVPFLADHLAEAYTRPFLPETLPPPALLLLSREGRVLFAGPWTDGAGARVASAIDRAFGAATGEAVTSRSGSRVDGASP